MKLDQPGTCSLQGSPAQEAIALSPVQSPRPPSTGPDPQSMLSKQPEVPFGLRTVFKARETLVHLPTLPLDSPGLGCTPHL